MYIVHIISSMLQRQLLSLARIVLCNKLEEMPPFLLIMCQVCSLLTVLVPTVYVQCTLKSATCICSSLLAVLCNVFQINELTTSVEPSLLLPEDFKAFSKIRVENQYYNKCVYVYIDSK